MALPSSDGPGRLLHHPRPAREPGWLAHPVLPRRQIPAARQAHARKKALVATGSSVLTVFHALLSDPAATYQDLGPGYYEQRRNTRRQARNHVRGLERLGYHVTIQAISPDTGELLTATA